MLTPPLILIHTSDVTYVTPCWPHQFGCKDKPTQILIHTSEGTLFQPHHAAWTQYMNNCIWIASLEWGAWFSAFRLSFRVVTPWLTPPHFSLKKVKHNLVTLKGPTGSYIPHLSTKLFMKDVTYRRRKKHQTRNQKVQETVKTVIRPFP